MDEEFNKSLFYSYFNDGLDLALFFVGFFIPFFGDIYESFIGGLIDLFTLITILKMANLKKGKRFYIYIVFIIELVDLTDFITLGAVDILGWIEIIPFWVIILKWIGKTNGNEDEMEHIVTDSDSNTDLNTNSNTALNTGSIPVLISEILGKKEINHSCPSCNAENPSENEICDTCGIILTSFMGRKNAPGKKNEKEEKV